MEVKEMDKEVKDAVTSNKSEASNDAKPVNKDRSKIYFFSIAIIALLLTNVYFYVKFKSSGEKLYTVALQKEKLQIEIDRIEAELDNITNQVSTDMTTDLQRELEAARKVIADLRKALEINSVTEEGLQNASAQIAALKGNVSKLKAESEELKFQNEVLKQENEKLSTEVKTVTSKVQQLSENNSELSEKVILASSVKVSNILVNGVARKRNGDLDVALKAKSVDELQIKFTIADNSLAKKGRKDVFVRVIDPQGNLIANSDNDFFVHGDKLQYTFKESINFTNNGEEYEFLWKDGKKFKKGAYTVLLYADNAIMGRSSVVLK